MSSGTRRRRKTEDVRSPLRVLRLRRFGSLSSAAYAAGISLSLMSAIERGVRRPTALSRPAIARAYGIDERDVDRLVPSCPVLPLGGDPYGNARRRGTVRLPKSLLARVIAECREVDESLEGWIVAACEERLRGAAAV